MVLLESLIMLREKLVTLTCNPMTEKERFQVNTSKSAEVKERPRLPSFAACSVQK